MQQLQAAPARCERAEQKSFYTAHVRASGHARPGVAECPRISAAEAEKTLLRDHVMPNRPVVIEGGASVRPAEGLPDGVSRGCWHQSGPIHSHMG